MAGRPRKPTAQKILEGTIRADRVKENEMMPSVITYAPSPPKFLSKGAKLEWKLVCNELISLGMLSGVDLALLAAYCQEMSVYVEACTRLTSEGYIMSTYREDGTAYHQQSPWVSIKNASLKNAQSLANQFGFTPSARAKLEAPERGEDPLIEAMKKLRESNNG